MQELQQQQLGIYFNKYQRILSLKQPQLAGISKVEQKVTQALDRGEIGIIRKGAQAHISRIGEQIKAKSQRFKKDLIMLDMSLSQGLTHRRDPSVRSVKSLLASSERHRANTQVSEKEFQEYQSRQITSQRRVRQLKKMKALLAQIKLKQQLDKKIKQQTAQEIALAQKQIEETQRKIEKMNKISERIRKLQQNRLERVQRLKKSATKSMPSIPRYKKMRYQFDVQEIIFENEQKQRKKLRLMLKNQESSPQTIKKHEQVYNKFLESRKRIYTEPAQKNELDLQQAQKNYNRLGVNPQKEAELKKRSRIKQYNNLIQQSRVRLRRDPSMTRKIEIIKDKAKNSFKYHYLNIKLGLSDEEIYQKYSDFNVENDRADMGNFYLKQLRIKNQQSRENREAKLSARAKTEQSSPHKEINTAQHEEKESKPLINKDASVKKSPFRKQTIKTQTRQELQQKAQKHLKKIYEKFSQLKNPYSYSNFLTIQKQIDQQFVDSLKAKIKCLKPK